MNNENTASQPKAASIADDAEFRKMCNVIAGGNLPDGAFFWLCIYLDSKLRAPADQAASVAMGVLCDLARYWDKNHIDADEAN